MPLFIVHTASREWLGGISHPIGSVLTDYFQFILKKPGREIIIKLHDNA